MQKTMLVSGVLSEMGAATARVFRQNGYYVFGVDRTDDYQYNCDRFLQFDLHKFCTEAEYRIRFAEIFDGLIPRLDVLILCAPRTKMPALRDLKLESWHKVQNYTTTGPMLLAKFFLSRLEEQRGNILFLNNTHDHQTEREHIGYQLITGTFGGLGRALAADLNGSVEVNVIHPKRLKREGFAGNKKQPGRDYADEVARLALFACSPAAGSLTGLDLRL